MKNLFTKTKLILVSVIILQSCSTDDDNGSTAVDTSKYFTYEINVTASNTTVSVTGLSQLWEDTTDPNKYELIIPNEFEGYPVTEIEDDAFREQMDITSVIIPDGVVQIGQSAFFMSGIETINIPHNVTIMEEDVFSLCQSLTAITVDASNPSFSAMDGVLYDKNQGVLLTYPAGLAGAFIMPNTVTNIEGYSFRSCDKLTGITMSNSLNSIGYGSFSGCVGLSNITIPNSVTTIRNYAFANCENLTSVIVNSTIPPTLESSGLQFNNCLSLTATNAIKVPVGTLNAYETAVNWSNYADIIDEQ